MQDQLPASGPIFSYHRPSALLAPYVAYYSVQHWLGAFSSPQFLPELGGSLILSLGPGGGQSTVWGPFTVMTTTGPPLPGLCARCFVEFRPGGLARLLYGNASELRDAKVPLEQVNARLARALYEQIERYDSGKGDGLTGLLCGLDGCLMQQLLHPLAGPQAQALQTLRLLQSCKAGQSAAGFAGMAHYSPRQVSRQMNALCGVAPKEYLRIKRAKQAAALLRDTGAPLEPIALRLHYYDTAHFVHDFQRILGVSPSQYRLNLSAFYNEKLSCL